MAFVNAVAWIANKQAHHPDLEVSYGHCVVRYTTHDAGNSLCMNDLICAAHIDALEDTDLEQVESIVLKTLQELGDGTKAIESSVLSAIINNWEMEFLWGLEDIQEKAETLQRYNHYLGQPDYLAQDLARYQNVTPEGIQDVINNYLTKEKMAKLIVMPEESDSEEGDTQ